MPGNLILEGELFKVPFMRKYLSLIIITTNIVDIPLEVVNIFKKAFRTIDIRLSTKFDGLCPLNFS